MSAAWDGVTRCDRCDRCDNGVIAEWVFCPYCGHPQTEEGVAEVDRLTKLQRLATPGQGEVPTDLDALAALAREATAGPWVVDDTNEQLFGVMKDGVLHYLGSADPGLFSTSPTTAEQEVANAAYIAAANPAVVLGLIERVQRAEARLDNLTELIAAAEECAGDLMSYVNDEISTRDRGQYPHLRLRYDRNIAPVDRLRAAVARVRGE